MIVIKNIGAENFELVSHLNLEAPGCRLAGSPSQTPMKLLPGEEICITNYEPGVSYSIRPVENPDVPRSLV